MIIFLEAGRLGNQIFQYAALRSIAKSKEMIVLIGFEDLRSTFDGCNSIFLCNRKSIFFRILTRYRAQLEKLINWQSIFGVIYENNQEAKLTIIKKKGLLDINYCLMSFFQTQDSFNPNVLLNITLKEKLIYNSSRILEKLSLSKKKIVFVHIRRGDYLSYPSIEFPAVLSVDWYMRCIDKMNKSMDNPFFIFFSDDTQFVQEFFGELPNKFISTASPSEDFALMSECNGGILSPSSFAWWAAYFIKRKSKDAYFIAPKFWIGHAKRKWHPEFIQTSFLEYEEVI